MRVTWGRGRESFGNSAWKVAVSEMMDKKTLERCPKEVNRIYTKAI